MLVDGLGCELGHVLGGKRVVLGDLEFCWLQSHAVADNEELLARNVNTFEDSLDFEVLTLSSH